MGVGIVETHRSRETGPAKGLKGVLLRGFEQGRLVTFMGPGHFCLMTPPSITGN